MIAMMLIGQGLHYQPRRTDLRVKPSFYLSAFVVLNHSAWSYLRTFKVKGHT